MTRNDTECLLKYMLKMYPNVKMTEPQFVSTVNIWAAEFEKDSCEDVGAAFRLARLESPDWMPSLPRIQNAMRIIASRVQFKSKEQEFKDKHCGKSESEWNSTIEWENSPRGALHIREIKEKINKLLQ